MNKQGTWLKQVSTPSGTFFDLFDTKRFGSVAKEFISIFLYCPPNKHRCHPGVLCSFKDFKRLFAAICNTLNGLTMLGKRETR